LEIVWPSSPVVILNELLEHFGHLSYMFPSHGPEFFPDNTILELILQLVFAVNRVREP